MVELKGLAAVSHGKELSCGSSSSSSKWVLFQNFLSFETFITKLEIVLAKQKNHTALES